MFWPIALVFGIVSICAYPPEGPPPAAAQGAAAQVNPQSAKAIVEKLASFGTRHTLSETESEERGIGAARRWIKATLEEYAKAGAPGNGMRVELEEFDAPPSARLPEGARIVNVVAVLPGTMPVEEGTSRRAYYVVAHYDSRNAEAMDAKGDAPGANDDASGVAVVMECARVLASRGALEQTVVFLCTAGEEQGLIGAKYHAENVATAKPYMIGGVLNNDIVGDPSSSPDAEGKSRETRDRIRVFSEALPRTAGAAEYARLRATAAEGDSPSRQLARLVSDVAVWHDLPVKPTLIFRQDRFMRGGDHVAFNEAGFAAVRLTEVDEVYDRQHVGITEKDGKPYGDLPEFVDEEYLGNVVKLNVAAIVHLASAPSAPTEVRIITAELGNDTLLRWAPSPEPDIAGYEVVWRETTSPVWQHAQNVGNFTEARLPIGKDDVFFGVRAYDKDGFRSPVVFPGVARE
jgi:Zn-dependent M28 family amino/carboxypeptidase